MTRSIGAPFAMTGKSATRHRTMERYRAVQGKNDYAYLAHDLAVGPADKFQFVRVLTKTDTSYLLLPLKSASIFRFQSADKGAAHFRTWQTASLTAS